MTGADPTLLTPLLSYYPCDVDIGWSSQVPLKPLCGTGPEVRGRCPTYSWGNVLSPPTSLSPDAPHLYNLDPFTISFWERLILGVEMCRVCQAVGTVFERHGAVKE